MASTSRLRRAGRTLTGAAIGVLLCLGVAQAAPNVAPHAPSSSRHLSWLGAWSGSESGPYALLTPGRAARKFNLSLYAMTPRAIAALPLCLSEELPLGTQSLRCWTPLRDCVRSLELSGSSAALSIRIGEASGTECRGPWGNSAIALNRDDFAAQVAGLYLTSDAARSQISSTLHGEVGAEATRSPTGVLLANSFRSAFGRDSALSLFESARWLAWIHGRLLAGCHGLPVGGTCASATVRRIIDQTVAETNKGSQTSPAAPARSRSVRGRTSKTGAPFSLGTWLEPAVTEAQPGPALEIDPQAPGRVAVRFGDDFGQFLADPQAGACLADDVPLGATQVTCSACDRRIRLRADGNRVLVQLLGDTWRTPTTGCDSLGSAWTDEGRYVFDLVRVDAFKDFAEPYLEAILHSDEGSSGGRQAYFMLGDHKLAVVRQLAQLIHNAYEQLGEDADSLSVSSVADLVTDVQMRLLVVCHGIPGGRPRPTCAPPAIEVHVQDTVKDWLARRAARR